MNQIDNRIRQVKAATGAKKPELVLKNARVLNVFINEFENGDVAIEGGTIVGIGSYEGEKEIDLTGKIIVPGFIDAHMHLESSIVTPNEYSKAVLAHGTCAVVADPHEIANVCGRDGIDFMLQITEDIPLEVFFMMPSCVPATDFDETGYQMNAEDVAHYMQNDRFLGLAEMMNFVGAVAADPEIMLKIDTAVKAGKIVDGHAPGLSGKNLDGYLTAGIYSDHECSSYEEGLVKLSHGQWIMLRESTACKNLESLIGLCKYPTSERCLFATDDKHPEELAVEGHIDHMIRKAINLGVDPIMAYKIASYNAARYFNLKNKGAICPGYMADLVILDDFEKVTIHSVYKAGELVCDVAKNWTLGSEKKLDESSVKASILNSVNMDLKTPEDFKLKKEKEKIIGLVPNEILTTDEGEANAIDVDRDILKIAVVERHHNRGHVGVCFLKGYGMKKGAIATSIAHDSHNIIVVGTNDEDIAFAVNEIHRMKGGMVVVEAGKTIAGLALPIAGLMCSLSVSEVHEQMEKLKKAAYGLGVNRDIDPFMTLSFTSLPVIPALKITTLGVVDVNKFELLK